MELSPEAEQRRAELARVAPLKPQVVWSRGAWEGQDVIFLCGTLGLEYDVWQRRLSVESAADALFAQQIGLDALEQALDETEADLRRTLAAEGCRLCPRWSPGYGDKPLSLSQLILDRTDATRRLGVTLTRSLLLVPTKSVTAICSIERGMR